jgi:hypothetical protein
MRNVCGMRHRKTRYDTCVMASFSSSNKSNASLLPCKAEQKGASRNVVASAICFACVCVCVCLCVHVSMCACNMYECERMMYECLQVQVTSACLRMQVSCSAKSRHVDDSPRKVEMWLHSYGCIRRRMMYVSMFITCE